jgi:thioredoxin 1
MYLGIFKRMMKNQDSKQEIPPSIKWPEYVVNLDEKNFNNFIEKYPLSVVDFWATWCAPCKAMVPRFRRLSTIYKGKVAFGKLDTQKNQKIAKQYKIMGIPHFIIFRNGKKVTSINGVKSVGYISKVIVDLLEKQDK